MKLASYNIQYGIGIDGQYDIARIIDAVRDADVIALQEVTRNNPRNGGRDMVAEIRAQLPGHFCAYGPNFEAEIGSHVRDGRAVDVRLEFGNMILSRTPILLSRNLLLPRSRSYGNFNFQRGALEALVDTPLGPVRFYSVHLDHRGADERRRQVSFLMQRVLQYPLEGGAISGTAELGLPEPPTPDAFVLMGDFNMLEGSPEYQIVAGTPDHEFGTPLVARHGVDAALLPGGDTRPTCINMDDPADETLWKRIDYCFVHASLASNVAGLRVDTEAAGSDHRPLLVELG